MINTPEILLLISLLSSYTLGIQVYRNPNLSLIYNDVSDLVKYKPHHFNALNIISAILYSVAIIQTFGISTIFWVVFFNVGVTGFLLFEKENNRMLHNLSAFIWLISLLGLQYFFLSAGVISLILMVFSLFMFVLFKTLKKGLSLPELFIVSQFVFVFITRSLF